MHVDRHICSVVVEVKCRAPSGLLSPERDEDLVVAASLSLALFVDHLPCLRVSVGCSRASTVRKGVQQTRFLVKYVGTSVLFVLGENRTEEGSWCCECIRACYSISLLSHRL